MNLGESKLTSVNLGLSPFRRWMQVFPRHTSSILATGAYTGTSICTGVLLCTMRERCSRLSLNRRSDWQELHLPVRLDLATACVRRATAIWQRVSMMNEGPIPEERVNIRWRRGDEHVFSESFQATPREPLLFDRFFHLNAAF